MSPLILGANGIYNRNIGKKKYNKKVSPIRKKGDKNRLPHNMYMAPTTLLFYQEIPDGPKRRW